jgi:acyl carrier protein
VECWRRYVSSKTVGFDDDFFETGGDSLDLIELHADLCEALGRELNLAAFFRKPVLRNICELVAQDAAYEIPYRAPARTVDRESAARRKAARETWLDQGNPS